MAGGVTARDVPEIRVRMAAWARDTGTDGAANWFTFFVDPEDVSPTRIFGRNDPVGADMAVGLAAQLPAAELFFVSEDMTALARHAATTLTDYRLHPEDLPAPVGLMVYATPPVADPVRDGTVHESVTIVSWGPGRTPDGPGLWVHTWAAVTDQATTWRRLGQALAGYPRETLLEMGMQGQRDNLTPSPDTPPTDEQAVRYMLSGWVNCLRRAPLPPSWHPTHGYFWCGLTPMTFTDMQGWPDDITPATRTADADPDAAAATARGEAKIALERTILATWLLMGQTIVRSEPVSAPRAARRRIARTDPALDAAVRYIDLRRARTEPSDNPEENQPRTRAYRHRWIVRGLN
ncbi:MAG TPA: hypothetical protein VEO01_24290 [Pseudonocardiaceae bacterium]|nr:hypothetical protein [Pseudonocardiaceae bacterium]